VVKEKEKTREKEQTRGKEQTKKNYIQ